MDKQERKSQMGHLMSLTVCAVCYFSVAVMADDVDDPRGKMTPWDKGAWETGQYRNVFLEAGYKQEDIDAKLAKAYGSV